MIVINACGLIVEYNPFHNGHQYHYENSKVKSNAECMIAVMSGNFLQRGEPAIIDKFHRAKIAVKQGIDIVVELPYVYAVQHSDIFAKGAVLTLNQLGVRSLCFGSEHGEIDTFVGAYDRYKNRQNEYQTILKKHLATGLSFPEASKRAYEAIGLTGSSFDLSKPNNILGFSYVQNIIDYELPITPITIKRTKSHYHDQEIQDKIASATSIRKELLAHNQLTMNASLALPIATQLELINYKSKAGIWHGWEKYFSLLHYRVITMSEIELHAIHGIEEGLEHRLKQTAPHATSFESWMQLLKTKRYTWTRLQRAFTHILTNTKKEDVIPIINQSDIPYIRLLGMSKKGQLYLNQIKKKLEVPLITGLKRNIRNLAAIDERASDAYYSVIIPQKRFILRKQEIMPPYIHTSK